MAKRARHRPDRGSETQRREGGREGERGRETQKEREINGLFKVSRDTLVPL